MLLDGRDLTPAPLETAGPDNYTWAKHGTGGSIAGYVFKTKKDFAEQIRRDYPNGAPTCDITGAPIYQGINCAIGWDGFGWYGTPPQRFPHIGNVRFGERVELGSNVTIDRGSIEDTIIGNDVKIDNGVHIGHNAIIGDESILTAHCVIGGSALLGKRVWVGLGAQIKNQIQIGDDAVIGMGAIVVKDVPPGVTVVGNPAKELEK
jgi:UDP-3-O-[3-hydroxymyristoyl] glucosamine N-acyltransferase